MGGNVFNRKSVLLCAGFGLLCVCVATAIWLRAPSLEQVARDGLKAVETRDANLLMRRMTHAEIDALHLNTDNVHRYLDVFVGRRLSGFVRTGEPKILPVSGSHQLIADQDYLHPDGRKVTVEITASVTPEGPRIASAIASLTFSMLMTDLSTGEGLPTGRRRLAFWGQALQKALPEFSSTGVTGLLRQGTPSGKDEVYTFEQFAERNQRLGAGESAAHVP